ncbi:YfhO family protein [Staphylococcus hyicus]|uniref:YfhO family protein n=1 Tax=Staphylococcus hyicus TaxID=1284 RepID=UPI00208EB083|nr:YfhO family protein [Staphylococcus hyicus]MCO4330690.1 YfhO family protein [Staphylococcus hyicus]MCO4333088.1 YfhO family protein [Staphylococcus hyicus]
MIRHFQHLSKRFIYIFLFSIALTTLLFIPFFYNTFINGIAFAGKGDGFSQLMPFQKYLYEHYTEFKSFYDTDFGLGGDYTKGLSYYYATSPLMIIYFFVIRVLDIIFNLPTHDMTFWAKNQVIISYIRVLLTTLVSYYCFRYLHPERRLVAILATIMYAVSVVTIYFNFTWSFYGEVLILLPLSIWAMERFFKARKIGLFIIAIALTLFSNFYFAYYEMIILGFYFLYRVIAQHSSDVVSRVQKIWMLATAAFISLLISLPGFFTGVSAVMENNREINPHLDMTLFIDFAEKYHIFSNGFYITISTITFIALFAINLYKYYYYRLFAILTWILLVGSLTPYFDSFFNGFSLPARRWIYILCLSSSVLIALFIRHLSEVKIKQFILTSIPTLMVMMLMYTQYEATMNWMWVTLLIIIVMGIVLWQRQWLTHHAMYYVWIGLILIQQGMMIFDYHQSHMSIYERPIASMKEDKYHSEKLQKEFDHIQQKGNPFSRIEYLSLSALNSPMIYGYNGLSIYSSLFNGDVLDYYDKTMQIAQPIDKNSTHRLLGNRANLMALWDAKDRFKNPKDDNLPYGFETEKIVDGKDNKYQYSKDTIHYPSTHITNKVFDPKDLKSPIDREHAMLQGIVLNDGTKANSQIQESTNYASLIETNTKDADFKEGKRFLKVKKDEGGLELKVPKTVAEENKDLYVEMDLEMVKPKDKAHQVKLNEYKQSRSSLNYTYRRAVTPITFRVKADETLRLKLSKGTYRYHLKGVYGENYETLKSAAKEVQKVKVKETKDGYAFIKNKRDAGYLVVPTPYVDGLEATADGQSVDVKKGNGMQTVIPVKKGQEHIELTYTPPHRMLLLIIMGIGIIAGILYTAFIARRLKKK